MTDADGGPTEATCTVVGVAEVGDRLCASRQRIVVVDHGSGAAGVLAVLGLDVAAAEALVAGEVAAGQVVDPGEGGGSDGDHGPDGPGGPPEVLVELRPAAVGDVTAQVLVGGEIVGTVTRTPAGVADAVLGILTRDRLARGSGTHLHGAALADRDGRAAVVLAPSGAGKSTLAAHLAASGLRLLNDEQVALHPAPGLLSGFTRPVAVKPGGAAHLPEPVASGHGRTAATTLVPAAELGAAHALTGQPVVVVLPERRAGPSVVGEPLTALDAIEALAANNLDLAHDPRAALEAYAWLARSAPVVRVGYETSRHGAVLVRSLLAEPPAFPPRASPMAPTVAVEPQRPPASGWRLRAAPGVVTVVADDGALLASPTGSRLVRVNERGADSWAGLPRPRWPADPDGRTFLADLVTAGVVEERWPDPGSEPPSLAVVAGRGPGAIGPAHDLAPELASVLARLAEASSSARRGDAWAVVLGAPASPTRRAAFRRWLDGAGLVALGADHPPGRRGAATRAGRLRSASTWVVPLPGLAGSIRYLALARRGATVVVLHHGSVQLESVHRGARRALAAVARRHPVRVLCTGGASTAEVAEALGLRVDAVVALPVTAPQLPVGEAPGDREALRAALGVGPERLVVVSVATPTTAADLHRTLTVAAAVEGRGVPVHLVLVGRGPVAAAGGRLARELGPDPALTVVDAPDVVDGFLLGADVHLLTADAPAGPRRVVAAMHAGLPTVAVGRGPGAALVEASGGGWVIEASATGRDADAVAQRLHHLALAPSARRRAGDRALAWARANHTTAAIDAAVASLLPPHHRHAQLPPDGPGGGAAG